MSYSDPNFTIVTSGGCNSFCSFCTDPYKRKAAPNYLENLVAMLNTNYLPDQFNQVSITGGEPTLSPDLQAILEAVTNSKKFNKVVLTTNGAKLLDVLDLIKTHVNYLNISRHAIGYDANVAIFGTKDIITDRDIFFACKELGQYNIPVNINHVYDDKDSLDEVYVRMFVGYARSLGATSVSFRYDQNQNSIQQTYLEKLFEHYPVVATGGCPVCRSHTIMLDGFPVTFKASYAEPSQAIADVFELIYHITGKLTIDWEGKEEFDFARRAKYLASWNPNNHPPVVNQVGPVPPKSTPRHAKRTTKSDEPPTVSQQINHITKAVVIKQQPKSKASPAAEQVPSYGGSCGFGGGCGSYSSDTIVARASDLNYGGSCGLRYGGGCGS